MTEERKKAEELVEKFKDSGYYENQGEMHYSSVIPKMYAAIVCDAGIEALQAIPDIDVIGNVLLDKIEFYQRVKEEIKNIN